MFPFSGLTPPMAQPPDEEEEENDGGVPLPPGYTQESTNFSELEGQEIIKETSANIGSSLALTPLIESIQPIVMSFFFGRALFMLINTFIVLISNCFRAFSTAVSFNHRITIDNRLKATAVAFGLALFIIYKASSIGFLGKDIDHVFPEKPPLLFREY